MDIKKLPHKGLMLQFGIHFGDVEYQHVFKKSTALTHISDDKSNVYDLQVDDVSSIESSELQFDSE